METSAVLRILFAEDRAEDLEIAVRTLRRDGIDFEHRCVETRDDFIEELTAFSPDIIVSDYSMPLFDGMSALRIALAHDRNLPFIVLTGSMNEDTAVECMKAGAVDYLIKSHSSRLPFALREALEKSRLRKEMDIAFKALEQSEQNYRNLANSGQALVWTADTSGACNYFNKIWLDFTGRDMEEERGDGWVKGVHPDDLAHCVETYRKAFGRRVPFSMEYRLLRRDGEYRWLQDDGCPRYDSEGSFKGYIGHCLDVTDHKNAEDRLARSLQEKESLLKEIFHRTRNNMQVIMSLLSYEEGLANDSRVTSIINTANEKILSMALVHKELMEAKDLSRIDLRDYTTHLVESLRENAGFPTERVRVTRQPEPIHALIDAAMPFGLVLHEVVTSAFRHAGTGDGEGEITVDLRRDSDGCIDLVVSLGGIGSSTTSLPGRDSSPGFQLVRGIVETQLMGSLDIEASDGFFAHVRFADSHFVKRV